MTQIESVKISKLKLLENNPRKIEKTQFDKLCKSLQEDPGFLHDRPILVHKTDGQLLVYAGNQRVRAAKKLGWKEIPCIIEEGLSEEIVKKRTIVDNKTYGEFDFEILANDFDMEMLFDAGFTAKDFDLGESPVEQIEGESEEDGEVLEPGKDEDSITRPGDLYELGDHRLVCGDSTMPDDVQKCLNGDEPILMVTDPPYGVNYNPSWRDPSKIGTDGIRSKVKSKGLVKSDDQANWGLTYSLFTGSVAYVWCASLFNHIIAKDLLNTNFELVSQIIWSKQNFILSRGDYHWQHEPCWYAVKKDHPHNWQGSRKEATVWEIIKANGYVKPKEGDENTGHSTQKPLECMARPIRNNSAKGEGVYDPFLGSGTTLIAAEMLCRKCYGLEISPAYVDICVRRWLKYMKKNGKDIILKKNGENINPDVYLNANE
jgi:DNA modification methylase